MQRACVPMVAFSMYTEGLLHTLYGSVWCVLHCCADLQKVKNNLELKIPSQGGALLGLGMCNSQ